MYSLNDVDAQRVPHVESGQRCPLVITGVWPDGSINGHAQISGAASLWVHTRYEGDKPGQWQRVAS